jgi:exodeoxyribonuclease VII small subunit
MQRLEEIVVLLENGKAGLDQSLAIFEEGVSLVALCNAKLTEAEQRVRILVAGEDGTPAEAPFTPNEVL